VKTVASVALALAMLVAPAPPRANAQAPAPKVTISGYIDVKNSAYDNVSFFDSDITTRETGWHTSTRGVFTLRGEVGKAKGVLALEIDLDWGQIGATDTVGRTGTDGATDLDTDTLVPFEFKSLYVEFPVPQVPFPATLTLGPAQPHRETFQFATLVHTDFPGVRLSLAPAPNVKWDTIYIQAEEALAGARFGFTRGEDWAVISHVTVTPFKGLDVKPIFAYHYIDGPTSVFSRSPTLGGLGPTGAAAAAFFPRGQIEERLTAGFDGMWRVGPWYFSPTFFYQWGDRELLQGGIKRDQDISAWFLDLRGGWRIGPLLLEAWGAYSTGNEAGDNLGNNAADPSRRRATINYYQPVARSSSWGSGWGLLLAANDIDYLFRTFGLAAGAIPLRHTYERYGVAHLAFRPSYDVTPGLTLQGLVGAAWTAEKVDTNSALVNAGTGSVALQPFDGRGDARYIGTELNARLIYRFAPGLEYTLGGGYAFLGEALEHGGPAGGAPRDAKNPWIMSQKITYRF